MKLKKNFKCIITGILSILAASMGYAQSTGINNSNPNSNAALDIRAVGIQGLLIPRHPGNVNGSFALPGTVAQGLMYYDTLNQVFRYHVGNNVWQVIGGALGDNLGNHTAIQNIQLGPYWLSADGGNEGIKIDNTGNVSIGTATPNARFTVNQNTATYTGHFINTSAGSSVAYGIYSGIADGNWAGHFVRTGAIGTGPTVRIQNTNATGSGTGLGIEQNGSGTALNVQATGTGRLAIFDAPGGNDVYISNDGNLGLGVATPAVQLHTSAGVRFGALGGSGTRMVVTDNLGNLGIQAIPTGTVTGSGAVNKIAFWNSTSNITLNTNFHWDNTNEYLGVGWGSPERPLHLHRAAALPVFSKYTNTSTTVGAGNGYETGIDASGNVLLNNMESTPISFHTAGIERMRISPTGFVGIGTTAPNYDLDIHSDGNGANAGIYTHWNFSNSGGVLNLGFSRGTQAAPVTLASSDGIGWINFQGYNGSTYQTGAWIRAYSAEAWTTTANGTKLDFMTRQIGTTSNSIRMTINDNGNIGIGTTGPINKLDVGGAAVIGTTYAGTNTAPANGLLVEGNVGIGKTATSYALDVTGEARIESTTNGVLSIQSNNT